MTVFVLRLLLLLRFLCFMALVYLGFHIVFTRLISRPDSKILWFFAVITSPLTRPIHTWMTPGLPEARLRLVALIVYGALWILITLAMQIMVRGLR